MKRILILIFLMLLAFSLISDEIANRITLQRNLDFHTAIKVIEQFSVNEVNKNIVNMSSYSGNIPVRINQIHWKEALELIISTLNLDLQEKPGVFIISDKTISRQTSEYSVNDKMIRISATFFRADKSFMNSMGINWSTLVDGEVTARIDFNAADKVADDLFAISGSKQFTEGTTVIEVNSLLKVLEANQKGSVIARPSITVLNGKQGNIQVGQDFSIKTADEAGNISDQFFSTGVILNVKPTIISEDDLELIYLEASVEKSNAIPGQISTVINKNQTKTDVLMFSGEETVLAGLIDVEYTKQRTGIPVLKDLPWWVFGLKYLFGYERFEQVNREMVVILKAEIVEPARERLIIKENLRQQFRKLREDFNEVVETVDDKPAEFKIQDLRK